MIIDCTEINNCSNQCSERGVVAREPDKVQAQRQENKNRSLRHRREWQWFIFLPTDTVSCDYVRFQE